MVPPGVDLERFSGAQVEPPREHVVLSVGRLVWEKGHQDVLRALAALRRGVVPLPPGAAAVRVVIVGTGAEEARLERYAAELGVADRVEFRRHVPYERDAACVRRGVVHGARQPAARRLGGAVRHGPGRGDGGTGADRRVHERGDPGGHRAAGGAGDPRRLDRARARTRGRPAGAAPRRRAPSTTTSAFRNSAPVPRPPGWPRLTTSFSQAPRRSRRAV